MTCSFTDSVVSLISGIPEGKVLTYGKIAAFAGNPRGARQVARILHSMSKKHNLPWHRVVNSKGKISLPKPYHFAYKKKLLLQEGVEFDAQERLDLSRYLWEPSVSQ